MANNYDYTNFPATPNAGKYSRWVPGQKIPREPSFEDWLIRGLLADGVPIGRGFYTDYVNQPLGSSNGAEPSFSNLAGERAAWQARKDAIDKAMREYPAGTGPFAPSKPKSTPKSTPKPTPKSTPKSTPKPTPKSTPKSTPAPTMGRPPKSNGSTPAPMGRR